ncbi:D-glucarate permease [Klebsiella pneumoniae]|uniref:D-glucarate permease n=1 Tax=Klebsiella pneumoniae TaxID=573 RepID=A0A377VAK4_KLEPN|nr:D-glucarate permease [Klebsiella pneumoniae]
MGWLTHEVGWSHVFFFMGGLGIVISFVWLKVIHDPNNHPGVNQKELDYIAEGGALINMDQKSSAQKVPFSVKMGQIKQLIGSRMMIGIYIGQYCINALTYFFITWFPGLSGAGARHVDPQSRLCRLDSGGVRLLSAGCWAG